MPFSKKMKKINRMTAKVLLSSTTTHVKELAQNQNKESQGILAKQF
jgi:hypothetical protein